MSDKKITIKFKKLSEDAVIPTYAHEGDVGMDLTAISVEYDTEKDMYVYHTGLAFASDFNIGQFLYPRSSNRKTDAYLCNHVGIADSAIYRGEIILCFKNRTSLKDRIAIESSNAFFKALENAGLTDASIALPSAIARKKCVEAELMATNPLEFAPYKVGDRVVQMVFMDYPTVELEEVSELNDTVRGDKAFGSSGN